MLGSFIDILCFVTGGLAGSYYRYFLRVLDMPALCCLVLQTQTKQSQTCDEGSLTCANRWQLRVHKTFVLALEAFQSASMDPSS